MNIEIGHLYFVSDEFFEKVNDPFLKQNYPSTMRPHYLPFLDLQSSLYWMVPCSSKVDKYQAIIDQRKSNHRRTDAIRIAVIQDQKTALLFQDMFPATEKYISMQYRRGGQPMRLADPRKVEDMARSARRVSAMLLRGVRFTPTQPDIQRIYDMMLAETETDKARREAAPATTPTGEEPFTKKEPE